MNLESALYMIPVNLSEAPEGDVLPARNIEITSSLKHFIVENVRTARRFLKRCDRSIDISTLTFYELNGHTDPTEISSYLTPLRNGEPMGVMSEAGCPGIADPGAAVVEIAQREGLRVIPLVGPSSILMSLMASGFNGQGFAFNGYLPIDDKARDRKIRDLESLSAKTGMTQIFIETPYRNNRMLERLCNILHPDTRICVACDITDRDNESIITLSARQWKGRKYDYHKRPAIFLIHK